MGATATVAEELLTDWMPSEAVRTKQSHPMTVTAGQDFLLAWHIFKCLSF
jgi:hypothetical protein